MHCPPNPTHACSANGTITLDHTLASYPGPLELACVQFPDPHFKARHKWVAPPVCLGCSAANLLLLGFCCLATAPHCCRPASELIPAALSPCPSWHRRKRHTVQRQLVEALGRLMEPGSRVFLQSDVLEVRRPACLHHFRPPVAASP